MMKSVFLGVVLLAVIFTPINAQSLVPDAVFRIFNVTYMSGGAEVIASTNEEAFVDQATAEGSTLGSNTEIIMDACTTSFHPCHANATCTDVNGTLGLIQCKCNSGYNQTASTMVYTSNGTSFIPDGTDCPDIDECDGNSTVCGSGTDQCFNSFGGYSCNCSAGFEYNSTALLCNDIDECSNSTLNNCHQNATCSNNAGSFGCMCNQGFSGDGVSCTEIDECMTRNITCGNRGNCSDPTGQTYFCDCDTGYSENTTADPKECQDVDECVGGTDNCDSSATCTNTDGSFTCACNTGYTGSGITCTDIDECTTSTPCHANATCSNTAGSYTCACNNGFTGDGVSCDAATHNFCYRLSITFEEATSGDTTSRATDADTAVSDFLGELVNGNVGFNYSDTSHTFEAVLGNTTVTEFIIDLCLNGSSQTPEELTSTLQNFNFTSTVGTQPITVLEYVECLTNYGNCSDDATCTNTDGDFYCTCPDTHADRSTSGVNGTICDLPTNFTCSSNTVNVTAYNPYFEGLGINYTELYLGSCSGSLSGDDILYAGECGAVVESNDTHLFYKWNLTNVNQSASVTVGNYVTIPITCTFLSSQNVSFNVSAERRDIVFGDDLNNIPGQAYDFTAEAFSDAGVSRALSGAINTNTKIFFRLGANNNLPSNVRIQCESFTTSAADGSSSSIQLMRNGCPVTRTNSNGRILDTLSIDRNGDSSTAVIGINSHFFGTSTVTLATFEVNACVEPTGGSNNECQYTCNARRKRSLITYRVRRETAASGEVKFAFERTPGDGCTRDCNEGGLCVYDATRNQQCVCADGFVEQYGYCREEVVENSAGDGGSSNGISTTIIVLIAVAAFLVILVLGFIFVFVFRKRRNNPKQQQYDVSGYVNTNGAESFKLE